SFFFVSSVGMRRRRILTLFPYTTLFRSDGIHHAVQDVLLVRKIVIYERFVYIRSACYVVYGSRIIAFPGKKFHSRIDYYFPGFVDRKSTRLNSSHVKISYAVYCSKKKK